MLALMFISIMVPASTSNASTANASCPELFAKERSYNQTTQDGIVVDLYWDSCNHVAWAQGRYGNNYNDTVSIHDEFGFGGPARSQGQSTWHTTALGMGSGHLFWACGRVVGGPSVCTTKFAVYY